MVFVKLTLEESGGSGRQFCIKFHNSPLWGDRESLEGTRSLTHLGRYILELGSHKNVMNTGEEYEGMHVPQSTMIIDHSGRDYANDAVTMKSKSKESGLAGSDSIPLIQT